MYVLLWPCHYFAKQNLKYVHFDALLNLGLGGAPIKMIASPNQNSKYITDVYRNAVPQSLAELSSKNRAHAIFSVYHMHYRASWSSCSGRLPCSSDRDRDPIVKEAANPKLTLKHRTLWEWNN